MKTPILSYTLLGGVLLTMTGFSGAQAPATPAPPAAGAAGPAPAAQVQPQSPAVTPVEPQPGLQQRLVHFEVFSLPPLKARKALIQYPDETKLYEWLEGEMGKKESGVKLEQSQVLLVRSGQRSKMEAINEFPYATEIDPPQIPQTITIAPAGQLAVQPADSGRVFSPWPTTSATPNSMEFRNTGWTCEVELIVGEDLRTADLNVAPQLVRLAALVPQGLKGDFIQPVFETQKVQSQVGTYLNQPALVSTFSPPTGCGAPGTGGKPDEVRLLFLTVKVPG